MNLGNAENLELCPRAEIAEYIDGELSPHAELDLEMHFLGCEICTHELNQQKKLLNALDFALEEEKEFEIPENFTKVVVANAENRVNGLRGSKERLNAILICAFLFFLVILGVAGESEKVVETGANFVEQIVAVGSFFGHLIYDFAIGLTVILKSLCFQFFYKSAFSFVLLAILLGISALVFSRLITEFKILGSKSD
ncbi:MAG TPA: zf-HC2 domain-containing protein [Pyrinomonadaceae bacterium]|nr:zf-HC2 domain-containing protein [Pyrinomonadaceae bacterium]